MIILLLLLLGGLGIRVGIIFNCRFAAYEALLSMDYLNVLVIFLIFELEILVVLVNVGVLVILLIVFVTLYELVVL